MKLTYYNFFQICLSFLCENILHCDTIAQTDHLFSFVSIFWLDQPFIYRSGILWWVSDAHCLHHRLTCLKFTAPKLPPLGDSTKIICVSLSGLHTHNNLHTYICTLDKCMSYSTSIANYSLQVSLATNRTQDESHWFGSSTLLLLKAAHLRCSLF